VETPTQGPRAATWGGQGRPGATGLGQSNRGDEGALRPRFVWKRPMRSIDRSEVCPCDGWGGHL